MYIVFRKPLWWKPVNHSCKNSSSSSLNSHVSWSLNHWMQNELNKKEPNRVYSVFKDDITLKNFHLHKYLLGCALNVFTRTGTCSKTRPKWGSLRQVRHSIAEVVSGLVYWHISIWFFFSIQWQKNIFLPKRHFYPMTFHP